MIAQSLHDPQILELRRQLSQALAQADLAGLIKTLTGLGEALLETHAPDALANFEQALRLARQAGDPLAEIQCLWNCANASDQTGDAQQAARLFHEVYLLAAQLSRPDVGLDALLRLAMLEHRLGRPGLRRQHLQQAAELAGCQADHVRQVQVWRLAGNLEMQTGNASQAVDCYRQAARLALSLGDLPALERCQLSLGQALERCGELPQALEQYEDALEISRGAGDVRAEMDALDQFIRLSHRAGDARLLEQFAAQALAIALSAEDLEAEMYYTSQYIRALTLNNQPEKALATVEKVLARIDASSQAADQRLHLLTHKGRLLIGLGQHRAAVQVFQEGLALAQAGYQELAEARFCQGLSAALAESGEIEAAAAVARRGLELAHDLQDEPLAAELSLQLATLLVDLGNSTEARHYLDIAIVVYQNLGQPAPLAKAQRFREGLAATAPAAPPPPSTAPAGGS